MKISADNPNLRFLAGKLREASFLRVMTELFNLIHVSLDVVLPTNLTKFFACCRWNQWHILSKRILITKVEIFFDSW